jgi:surfeit locus 1 family protein
MSFRAPTPVALLAVALAAAFLVLLGIWQLERHEWKQGIVAEREARLAAPPAAAPSLIRLPLDEVDFRRVSVDGTWDHEHTMVLANRGRFGIKGEEVVVPLLLASGGPAVLVNRGWYPDTERDRVLGALAQDADADVEGLARVMSGFRGARTPAGTWTNLDPDAMARDLPYIVLPWVIVEGDLVERETIGGGVFPAQGYLAYRNTTPHIEYAITWFGLAAALVAVAVVRLIIVPRREARRAPPFPERG